MTSDVLATWVAGCRTPLLEALPECLESSIAFAAGCETPLDELLVLWVVNLGGIDQTLFASGALVNVGSQSMASNAPITTTASCASDAHG